MLTVSDRETDTPTTNDHVRTHAVHIVGIGASAVDSTPSSASSTTCEDTGWRSYRPASLADFKSMMDDSSLVIPSSHPSRRRRMPIEADHVYLNPPKNEMILSAGVFS